MTRHPTPALEETAPAPGLRGIALGADRALVFTGMVMLLEVLKFLISGNGEAADLTGAGDPVGRAVWYPLYLAILIALAARIGALLRLLLPAWPIFALLVVSAASQFWSVAPDLTSRRAVAVAFTVLFGVYLALREDRLGTWRIMGAAIVAAAAFNLAVVAAVPSMGIDQVLHAGAWKGVTVEKNALGGNMARAALVLMALAYLDARSRWIWIGGIAVCAVLVLGSTSRTGLLALAIPAALLGLHLIARRSPVMALGVFYVSATLTGAAALFVYFAPEQAVGLIGKDMTLTGRTGIWEASMGKILDVPWTGYGLGAFWVDPLGPSYDVRTQLEWLVPSAHNSWIEIGLALGLPGMALMAVLVGSALVRSGFSIFRGAPPFLFLGLVQLTLFSFSESAIFWYQNTFSCALFGFYAAAALMPGPRADTEAPTMPERLRRAPDG